MSEKNSEWASWFRKRTCSRCGRQPSEIALNRCPSLQHRKSFLKPEPDYEPPRLALSVRDSPDAFCRGNSDRSCRGIPYNAATSRTDASSVRPSGETAERGARFHQWVGNEGVPARSKFDDDGKGRVLTPFGSGRKWPSKELYANCSRL
jgi:hypothetical protein